MVSRKREASARSLAGMPHLRTGTGGVCPLPLQLAAFSGCALVKGSRGGTWNRTLSVVDAIVLFVGVGVNTAPAIGRYLVSVNYIGNHIRAFSVESRSTTAVSRYFTCISRGAYALTELGRQRFVDLAHNVL
mgnify:CR=1 FL=1